MQAAIAQGAGQSPVYAEFAEPAAEAGEQRVHVSAAAISPVVRSRAAGTHYSSSRTWPFVVGLDGVGRLDDGRRVAFAMCRSPFGSMAERTVVPAAFCIPLPDSLDDATAAAILNPGMSSWASLVERARLAPGQTVLVNGATGAAGRLAVQIARHLGAVRVIATGRNPEALATVGADVAIPLGEDGDVLEARFKAEFARGIDVVLDYLWGESALRLLIAGARAGPDAVPIRFVQIGSASGTEISLPSAVLRSSAIELIGSGLGSIPLSRLVGSIGALLAAAPTGGFAIATRMAPLAQVAAVWNLDGGRRTVLTV